MEVFRNQSSTPPKVPRIIDDQSGANGGGLVFLPSGTIYAKNLQIPYSVTLRGQGVDATTLKLLMVQIHLFYRLAPMLKIKHGLTSVGLKI